MSTLIEVRVPSDESEGTRSQLQRWLKAPGQLVALNEPLIELETDKVNVEVPAPADGVLYEIFKQEQDELAPGELLATIRVDTRDVVQDPDRSVAQSVAQSVEQDVDQGVDQGVTGRIASTSAAPATTVGSALASQESDGATNATGGVSEHIEESARERLIGSKTPHRAKAVGGATGASRISPAVRRLLAERGLEAADVTGTGGGGRITVDDILDHATGLNHAADNPVAAPAQSAPRMQEVRGERVSKDAEAPAGRRVAHSGMRKRIAERMVESLLHTAPHVTTIFEADMSAVLGHRARHRADFEQRGAPLTLTAYFLVACVDALREVPEANSRWTSDALEIPDRIDIGVGSAVEGRGLMVPVVRGLQSLDLFAVAHELGRLVERARENKLTPADVRGGTFTISNHGVSGSLIATPIIINQPQSAILGVGKLEKRVVVVSGHGEDRIVIQPRCYVTLTVDHRVMDGHRANRFLQVLVQRLEHWTD